MWEAGTAIPWLALLDKDDVVGANRDVLTASPAAWTWDVTWPKNVAEMKIGQTLTSAADSFLVCQMALEDGMEGYVALRIPISPGRAYEEGRLATLL